jgi:hypothetical protein
VFENGVAIANQKAGGKYLKTMWDACELEPTGPYVNFFWSSRKSAFKKQIKYSNLWSKNPINEFGKLEIFNRMERAKLCTSIINQLMNLDFIKLNCEYIDDQYILHSEYDLLGEK